MPLNLSTIVIARVSKLPYIGVPQEKPMKIHEVLITAIPTPEPKPTGIPLWLIILAAIIGILILMLLSYILYKVSAQLLIFRLHQAIYYTLFYFNSHQIN